MSTENRTSHNTGEVFTTEQSASTNEKTVSKRLAIALIWVAAIGVFTHFVARFLWSWSCVDSYECAQIQSPASFTERFSYYPQDILWDVVILHVLSLVAGALFIAPIVAAITLVRGLYGYVRYGNSAHYVGEDTIRELHYVIGTFIVGIVFVGIYKLLFWSFLVTGNV